MKKITLLTSLIFFSFLLFQSCKRKGCTDSKATNYDSKAKKDDGGCIYPIVEEEDKSCKNSTIESSVQFCANINGKDIYYDYEGGDYFTSSPISGGLASPGDTSYYKYACEISIENPDDTWGDPIPLINIYKGTLKTMNGYPKKAEFEAFFAKGSYSFSIDNDASSSLGCYPNDGFSVNWYDKDTQTQWSSCFGTANQSGSSISIVDFKYSSGGGSGGGYIWYKILIKFNCNLYDNSGNVIELKDGVFVGEVVMDNYWLE